MAEVSVRRMEPADAERLAELASATFPLACPPDMAPDAIAHYIRSNLTPAHFSSYLTDPQHVILAAEDGDAHLVGYTMLIAGEPTDADAAAALAERPAVQLSKFYTRQSAHGTGVAAPLMRATLDAAAGTGSRVCWLGVNQENHRAIAFYEKHGFRTVGRKRFLVGDQWGEDWVMARPLERPTN